MAAASSSSGSTAGDARHDRTRDGGQGGAAGQGTSRLGRAVTVAFEGDELTRRLLHRARKGSLAAPKIKVRGFAREG